MDDADITILLDRSVPVEQLQDHFKGRNFSRRDIAKIRNFLVRRFADNDPDLLMEIFGDILNEE